MSGRHSLHVTTPTPLEVVLTRDFSAPRRLVWDALTRCDLLKRWLTASGRTLEICDVDFRVGGTYRYVWRGAGKKDVGTRGLYREIVPVERISYVETWEDWDAGETLVTSVLTERGGITRLATNITYPSQDVRDAVLKSGMERGAGESYNHLDDYLAATSTPAIVIYQKPVCTTCKQVYAALKASGVDFESVDYYVDPIPKAKLKELLGKMGMEPRDLLRTKEAVYKTLKLGERDLPDDEIVDLMVAHPELIQRPIVEKGPRAILARPAERLREIL